MDVVFFNDTMEHVCRLCRILALQVNGHALLLGGAASGKKSLARVAAFFCGYEVVEIKVTNKNISNMLLLRINI